MAFSFFQKKDLVGLDVGSGAIKLVGLDRSRKGHVLQAFGVKPLDPELIVDGRVMDVGRVVSVIKDLVAEQTIKIHDVALSVSGHSVIVKKIALPVMTENELRGSIKWEAEQYIPFDMNDVNLDFHILGQSHGPNAELQMDVILVAIKKDKLAEYTALVEEAGLDPVVVDVDAFTLENMYNLNYEFRQGETTAILNVGASVVNIHIMQGGQFSLTRDISMGGWRYNEMIQREFSVSDQQAEAAKRMEPVEGIDPERLVTVMDGVNKEIATEVARSLDYYKTTAGIERIDRVMISGGVYSVPNLIPHLNSRLGIEVEIVNPFSKVQISPKQFDMDYIQKMAPAAAVCVGLAMRR